MKMKWINIFTVLIVISVTLTLYFSYIILKHDYIGALAEIKGDKVYVTAIEPLTWADNNLEVGDRLISIDGKDPLEMQKIREWNMLEQAKTMETVGVDGVNETHYVENKFDTQIVFQFLIPLIIVAISFYCSYLIYKSYRRSENTKGSSLLLILFLSTFSLAYMCGGASARGDGFSRILVSLLLIATPTTYLHFMHSYYKELNTVWFSKKWIWISYSLIPLNLISLEFKEVFNFDGQFLKTMNLASFLIVFIFCAILISVGLKKVAYKTQKYMIRVLVISNAFAFIPFLLLYVLPYVLFKVEIISPVFLTGFLLFIPFSLVYQFLATKIYDLEFIVGRIKYYSLIAIIPSIAGVILLINIKSGNPTVFSIRTFIMMFIIMVVTLHYKEILDYKFKFNRLSEKANYQNKLSSYTEEIRIAKNLYEVSAILKKTIMEVLLINKAHLIEINKEDEVITKDFVGECVSKKYSIAIDRIKDRLGYIEEIDNGFLFNIGDTKGKTYIILALSDINTPILTRDERQWLKNLAYYTNVTLENFVKIEDLMHHLEELENKPTWLNKIVFNLEEKQRSELAKDLHDSVLQDLIGSKRHVEVLYATYKDMDENDLDKEVKRLLCNMSNSIETTRKTCNELRPQLLYDLGLDKALNKLASQNQNEKFEIKITTSKLDGSIREDVQLNIYRIAQELLNNARKHSYANSIRIVAVKIKEKIVLHYEDDGVGEDLEFIENKEGSMGLSGIKERVRVLGGTVKIETEPGKGFKVVVEV